jgi:hypothetical protein
MPFASHSRLVSRLPGLPDSSAFPKPMCGRRWHRTNQGGEVAARTMSAEIPPVRCCGGGGRTGSNFQMENRPAGMGYKLRAEGLQQARPISVAVKGGNGSPTDVVAFGERVSVSPAINSRSSCRLKSMLWERCLATKAWQSWSIHSTGRPTCARCT